MSACAPVKAPQSVLEAKTVAGFIAVETSVNENVPDPSDPSRAKDPLKPRDGKNNLTYKFVNAYPIAISSMPVAYDSSSVLKCTVSFTYIRYYIENLSEENYNS